MNVTRLYKSVHSPDASVQPVTVHSTRDRAASDALDKLVAAQASQVSAVAEAWRTKYPTKSDFVNPLAALLQPRGTQSFSIDGLDIATWYLATLNRSPSLRPKYHFSDEISSGASEGDDENLDAPLSSDLSDPPKESTIPSDLASPTSIFVKFIRRKQSRVPTTRLTSKALKIWTRSQTANPVVSDPVWTWLTTSLAEPVDVSCELTPSCCHTLTKFSHLKLCFIYLYYLFEDANNLRR